MSEISEIFLSAQDIAHWLQVPLPTVYRWASLSGWRRTRTRPRMYSAEDAEASFNQMRRGQQ